MIKNYFKSAFRNLIRNKLFSAINILGLAIGLASFYLIIIYVINEIDYDKHHKRSDDIYRVIMRTDMSGNVIEAAVSGGILGKILYEELPEVLKYTRFYQTPRPVLLSSGEKDFNQDKILFVDSSFFEVFSYDFVSGDPKTVLIEPFSLVITENIAKKFFGDENPIGKSIKWNNSDNYIVKGLIKNQEHNSHINSEIFASHSSLYQHSLLKYYVDNLFAFVTQNYVVLNENALAQRVEEKIPELVKKYMGNGMDETGANFEFFLQPIKSIHLHSDLVHELESNGDINNVYMFSVIAILILLIACINFVNLSTAGSSMRALEVGIRKVCGANKAMLFRQYIIESLIISIISLIIAYLFIELFLPFFNEVTGKEFSVDFFSNWQFSLAFIVLTIFIGFLSGTYPAIYLSAFNPLKVLKGNTTKGSGRSMFRNIMVIIQFTISIILICSTIVIYKQLSYIKNKDIGINKDDLLVIPMRGGDVISKYQTIKAELSNLNGVKNVSASSSFLGKFGQRRGYYAEGTLRRNTFMILNLQVDDNYLNMMEIDLLSGRNFFKDSELDSNAIIINKALMDHLGWKEAIGKSIYIAADSIINDYQLKVIGVMDNFNYASLHEEIKPLLIHVQANRLRYIYVKINPSDQKKVLSTIESKWNELNPDTPFDYFFQESKFGELYSSEQKMGNLFIYFSILAIFIALLGLFGLSLFSINQRVKEIGIRKVLGSGVFEIVSFLSINFLKLVLISSVIAIPIAWFSMNKWLQNFAFSTQLSWWIFVVSALFAILISLITVILQSYFSAIKNPVDSLRYE
ncbi:MAG: ABC transporter permease [Bacteroidales bacterium]|nr:ABC transporter permease [Bacteroidales bacterium]